MEAPGGQGADRNVATTVAMPTGSPAPPAQQVGQHLTHGPTTSASSSKARSEWPATKSSMCGHAATMPCCTGS